MKFYIKSDGHNIRLALPNRMIFSSLALKIANKTSKDGEDPIPLTASELRRIRKTIKRIKKLHRGLAIVDAESAEGDMIKMFL